MAFVMSLASLSCPSDQRKSLRITMAREKGIGAPGEIISVGRRSNAGFYG